MDTHLQLDVPEDFFIKVLQNISWIWVRCFSL